MQYGHPHCGGKLMHSNLMFGDGSVSTLFIQQLRSSPILCTLERFEKKKFHPLLDLYLARHTVDSVGFPILLGCCLQHLTHQPGSHINPGPLLRQWCARHCGLAALCQQRQLRGGEARSIGVDMCRHISSPGIQVD